MKRLFCFWALVAALIGTVNAQNKTTMLEVHDFIGFGNTSNLNLSGTIDNINGRRYDSWIDGNPRFSVSNVQWATWHESNDDNKPTYLVAWNGNGEFTINGLFAGDVVTVETLGECSANGTPLSAGFNDIEVSSDGSLTILCSGGFSGIRKVSIATQHMATYVIDHQTYTFTSGGVLPDKRKAVPYITMSFGNEDMDYAYVKYYGMENGQKQFGSFILTETMDDTYFKDYGTGENYYENQPNWNTTDGPYVLKEPVVFRGKDFSEYVPWHGTYYYFYPETNGYLYIHMHSDPVTNGLHNSPDVMFLWDKTTNVLEDSYNFNYTTEGFYKFEDPQVAGKGVRVYKNHVYFMCTTPNDAARRNVAHLLDYTFVPDFTMTPLYAVIDPGYEPQKSGQIAVSELKYTDNNPNLHYRVKKCLGNIASATVKIENNQLYFTNITYKSGKANKGGAVIVDVDCTDGQADFVLTVPYSAEPIDGTGNEVKKWDFYSNIIDNAEVDYNQIDNTGQTYQPFVDADAPMMGKTHLGQWKTEGSGLRYETEKDPGEWLNTFINLEGDGIEPIFKNVYDIEGDNADMIWDTNGLIFHAQSTSTGIYNENDAPSSTFQDRYIGLMKGSEFTIPRLSAGDRIVIKMGTYGNLTDAPETTTLNITGANDAVGNPISGDYVIGGSAPVEGDVADDNGNYVPRGEYHFIATGSEISDPDNPGQTITTNADVTFKVTDGQLLKLYTIQIYTNDEIVTENEILGDPDDDNKCYILNTQGASTNDDVLLHAHYNGLNEPFGYHAEEVKTGNLADGDLDVRSSNKNDNWYDFGLTTQPTVAGTEKFGVFKAKIGVKTIGQYDTYVTDYAYCMVPVGYRETKEYPYTWDFTDLKKYVSAGIDTDGTEKKLDEEDNDLIEDDLKIWNGYGLRTNPEKYDGYIFAPGGQLYGGTTMFDETRGIGILNNNAENKSMTMNGSADAEDGGLAVSDEFGFVIPKVAKKQAIYVHATPKGNTQSATFAIGNGEAKSFTYAKDGIFAMQMADNATTSDVTLNFKGYEIKKIAVSTDAKTVNRLGWATESRARVIDPALTSEMTGYPFETYIVTGASYANKTVTLTPVDVDNYVIPEAADGDKNAYIIRNTKLDDTRIVNDIPEPGRVQILNNGFHLFVPDMHDYQAENVGKTDSENNSLNQKSENDMDDNMLVSLLTAGTVVNKQSSGNIYNYALTSQKNKVGDDNQTYLDEIGFYRIKDGTTTSGNQAYLPVDCTVTTGTTVTPGAKMSIIFESFDNPGETVETAIEVPFEEVFGDSNAAYYNLNGQKLNGKPTKSGLYIMNGKKILVK